MSQIVALSLLVGFLGVLLPSLKMPHPYEGLRAMKIPEDKLANLPPFPPDFTGAIRLNTLLERSTRVFEGQVHGAEHVDISPDGATMYLLDRYGYMHTAAVGSDGVPKDLKQNVTFVGPGRPLGFKVTANSVLVACSLKGLMRVTWTDEPGKDKRRRYHKEILANQGPDGAPIHYANAVTLDPATGDVYFTTSTARPVSLNSEGYYDTLRGSILNALRGDASGRVLKYEHATGKVSLIAENLWFPNGIAVSDDGMWLYYVETFGFRVLKRNLRTNHQSVLIDRLPAHPDGLSIAPNGNLWISLVSPLSALTLAFPYTTLRAVLAHVIHFVMLLVKAQGLVVQVSPEGEVVSTLADPAGEHVFSVSSAHEVNDVLYMGCLSGDFVSYYRLNPGTS